MSATDPFAPKTLHEQADEADVKAEEARAHADYLRAEAVKADAPASSTVANLITPDEHRVVLNG